MLTSTRIIEIADATKTAEPGANGFILPVSFARAIEEEVGKRDRAIIKSLLDALDAFGRIDFAETAAAARARLGEKEPT